MRISAICSGRCQSFPTSFKLVEFLASYANEKARESHGLYEFAFELILDADSFRGLCHRELKGCILFGSGDPLNCFEFVW